MKKNKIKMMNNKISINIYLSAIESKNQTRKTGTESWIWRVFDGCQMGHGCGRIDEEVRGLRSTNR